MTGEHDPGDEPEAAREREVAEEAAATGRFPDDDGRLRDDSSPVEPPSRTDHLRSPSQGARPGT